MVTSRPRTIVVTGLPRSGTSLMMQMLAAGGVDMASDGLRPPDHDNPYGYYELEKVKRLQPDDTSLLDALRGRAVKIVVPLIYRLPPQAVCDVLVMERASDEIAVSQRVMLARQDRQGTGADEEVVPLFAERYAQFWRWLDARPRLRALGVPFADLIADPRRATERVAAFLNRPLDTIAMRAAVRPSLHRNRSSRSPAPCS
jgi:hypothetical protein